jgi:hypothetical protein
MHVRLQNKIGLFRYGQTYENYTNVKQAFVSEFYFLCQSVSTVIKSISWSGIQSFIHSYFHPFRQWVHSFIHSFFLSSIQRISPFIHSFIHPPTQIMSPFIYPSFQKLSPFIRSFTHSLSLTDCVSLKWGPLTHAQTQSLQHHSSALVSSCKLFQKQPVRLSRASIQSQISARPLRGETIVLSATLIRRKDTA